MEQDRAVQAAEALRRIPTVEEKESSKHVLCPSLIEGNIIYSQLSSGVRNQSGTEEVCANIIHQLATHRSGRFEPQLIHPNCGAWLDAGGSLPHDVSFMFTLVSIILLIDVFGVFTIP